MLEKFQDSSEAAREFLIDAFELPTGDKPSISIYQPHSSIPTPISPVPTRPYVTLTFAQSLDAKIAGPNGKQLSLSGFESMLMTHWRVISNILNVCLFMRQTSRMRTMHDAILIGVGTALNDDPQLNSKFLSADSCVDTDTMKSQTPSSFVSRLLSAIS